MATNINTKSNPNPHTTPSYYCGTYIRVYGVYGLNEDSDIRSIEFDPTTIEIAVQRLPIERVGNARLDLPETIPDMHIIIIRFV